MELDYKAIGKRIKIARIKADLTQERLAERIGISPTHLSNIENRDYPCEFEYHYQYRQRFIRYRR